MQDKYVGIGKVGEKGQVVIPKDLREMFNIKPGDSIVFLADTAKGIAIVKADIVEEFTDSILGGLNNDSNKNK